MDVDNKADPNATVTAEELVLQRMQAERCRLVADFLLCVFNEGVAGIGVRFDIQEFLVGVLGEIE